MIHRWTITWCHHNAIITVTLVYLVSLVYHVALVKRVIVFVILHLTKPLMFVYLLHLHSSGICHLVCHSHIHYILLSVTTKNPIGSSAIHRKKNFVSTWWWMGSFLYKQINCIFLCLFCRSCNTCRKTGLLLLLFWFFLWSWSW